MGRKACDPWRVMKRDQPERKAGSPRILWWCLTCGMVWAADDAPWCRHHAPEMSPTKMKPLPSWHPFVESAE